MKMVIQTASMKQASESDIQMIILLQIQSSFRPRRDQSSRKQSLLTLAKDLLAMPLTHRIWSRHIYIQHKWDVQ